jgi:hypothetical protein
MGSGRAAVALSRVAVKRRIALVDSIACYCLWVLILKRMQMKQLMLHALCIMLQYFQVVEIRCGSNSVVHVCDNLGLSKV